MPSIGLVSAVALGLPVHAAATGCEVARLAAGGYGSLAVMASDGTIRTWGFSSILGNGSGSNSSVPVQPNAPVPPGGSIAGAVAVAAGNSHGMALLADGTVLTWGANAFSQLGSGTSIGVPAGTTVRVVSPSGTGALGHIVSVAAGELHSMALNDGGTVWAWGFNDEGELGNGRTGPPFGSPAPSQVVTESGVPLSRVVAISGGTLHSLALDADGAVWAWGFNGQGQLGDGTTTTRLKAVRVTGLPAPAVSIAAGGFHSVAILTDGSVWRWGHTQLGILFGPTVPTPIPERVLGIPAATRAAAGLWHSLILTAQGTVFGWSSFNSAGAVGDGTTDSTITPRQALEQTSPSGTRPLGSVVAVAGGSFHSLALKSDGTVWAWGFAGFGSLGNGAQLGTPVPSPDSHVAIRSLVSGAALPVACQAPRGGPQLLVNVSSPDRLGLSRWDYTPNPFTVSAMAKNTGTDVARGITLSLILPAGLALATGESAAHALVDLAPGDLGSTSWKVVAAPQPNPTQLRYLVRTVATSVAEQFTGGMILLPRSRPHYVAFGDSLTTGFSATACVEERKTSPWGCISSSPPATPYPDRVARFFGYSTSDDPSFYAHFFTAPGYPDLDLDRVGIWGYTAAEAFAAHAAGVNGDGPWTPQSEVIEHAFNLVTGALGIDDLQFDNIGFWLKPYLVDRSLCGVLIEGPLCPHAVRTQAEQIILHDQRDALTDLVVSLKTAQLGGARVVVTLYFDPYFDRPACFVTRSVAETLLGVLNSELRARAASGGLLVADFKALFEGHGAGTPLPQERWVFGTKCQVFDGLWELRPKWVPRQAPGGFAAVVRDFDPHPNDLGTDAMAKEILRVLGVVP